ncbi:MAG: hypothetical protein H6602_14485 [Flavobacteriales bacterium]|nr:hypothetical protein [Flavobacteriales bacterium]
MKFLFFSFFILSSSLAHSQGKLICVYGTGNGKIVKWENRNLDSIPSRLDSLFYTDFGYWFMSFDSNGRLAAEGSFVPNDSRSYVFKSFAERISTENPDTVRLIADYYWIANSEGRLRFVDTKPDNYSTETVPCDDCPILDRFGMTTTLTEEEIKRLARH